MRELLELYTDCLEGRKGMNQFVSYAESKALFGCSPEIAGEIDELYLDLVARQTPDFVLPC